MKRNFELSVSSVTLTTLTLTTLTIRTKGGARMQAGYSARCKVCNSPHRAEIEKWVKEEGISVREAARRMEEMDEKISHEAIRRHMLEHFDVKAEVREQYQKSQEQYQKTVEKRLSDIEMLDATINDNFELSQATTIWLKTLIEKREKIPLSLVQLREKLQSEMRQAIKLKQELLGDDPESKKADALVATLEELQELYINAHGSQERTES